MSDNDISPFIKLISFARQCADEAILRVAQANGKRRSRGVLYELVTPRELQLIELVSACRSSWALTGFPSPEVERRVNTLGEPIRALLFWELKAPRRAANDDEDPAVTYLSEHTHKIEVALDDVMALADAARKQLPPAINQKHDPEWWENAQALEINRVTNEHASQSKSRAGVRHQNRTGPNFAEWGIGFDPTTGWHIFRLTHQGWRYAKKKLQLASGIQKYLINCLLSEKGTLKRSSIFQYFDKTRTRPKKIDCYLSRLRKTLLNGIGHLNSTRNPLEKTRGDSSWQLHIKIGQAEKVDPQFIGSAPEFSFIPCE